MPKADMLKFGSRGMNGDADPRLLSPEQYAKGINVQLHGQCVGTRYGIKVHDISGDGLEELNFQGACFYNPGRGQSYQGFGADVASIAVAAGGRTYKIRPSAGKFHVNEITYGLQRDADWHQCNLFQAENYLIAQQPTGNTWIYDGKGSARWSSGLNVTDKEASELANGSSAGAYIFNRVHQVVNGRMILVGDIIHKSSGSTASNIIRTTEQSYWNTGSFFAPPSEWDDVVAIEPIMNAGGSDVESIAACHSPSGVMALLTNKAPRSSWASSSMTRHLVLGAGAMGPNAVTNLMEGDQIFRSRHGIQSIKLIASTNNQIGSPMRQIGEEVNKWLSQDSEPLLRYASVEKEEKQRRIYCTVAPLVVGKRWMHRGLISMNLLPSGTRDIVPAWEALITLPDEAKFPIQLVSGQFEGSQRTFCFCYGTDNKLRLIEFTPQRVDDIGLDCLQAPIPSTVITGAFTGGFPFFNKTFNAIGVKFSNIIGKLEWKISYRTEKNMNWRPLVSEGVATFASCSKDEPFTTFHPGEVGKRYAVPDSDNKAAWIQAKVSWVGIANVEGPWVDYNPVDPLANTSDFDDRCSSIPVENCDGDFTHSV
jgi:hypothetical protein